MFLSIKKIPHPIPSANRPDPESAQALQEGLGGQFGEMRTMMQYFSEYELSGLCNSLSRFTQEYGNRGDGTCRTNYQYYQHAT